MKTLMKIQTMLLALLMVSVLIVPGTAEAGYKGSSLEGYITEMIDKEIMQGYPDGTFRHTEPVTRVEFTVILYRALDIQEADDEAPFTDLPGRDEFVSAISAAYEAGIISGYDDGTFRPDDKIERQQMAVMIDRAFEHLGYRTIVGTIDVPDFMDKDQISRRFTEAVNYVTSLGIIRGNTNGTFAPNDNAQRGHAAAFLSRMLTVIETGADLSGGDQPDEGSGSYQLAVISQNGSITTRSGRYESFEDAYKNRGARSDLILNDGEIVHMQSGIVRPNNRPGAINNVYSVYDNGAFLSAFTYITSDHRFTSELTYLGGDERHIKVSVAGRTGYVRAGEFELIPSQQATERNHYVKATNGFLVHRLYDPSYNQNQGRYVSYTYGKAPSFMETGKRYYSEDGGTFYTGNGEKAGEAYQYFNRLPIKSESRYTAEELDHYIREHAGSASKMQGMGKYLKEAEARYGVNALFILGAAAHESAFGNSVIARDTNNLYGIRATDSDPYVNASRFDTVRESTMSFASTYMLNGYMHYNPAGNLLTQRFQGAIPGTKAVGANVRYASDMFWGQKIAGHMFRADRYLGGKDFVRYRIAETTVSGLNVRTEPDSTKNNVLYQYARSAMPVIIFDEAKAPNGATWYHVTADHKDHKRAYIHSSYVKEVPFAK
ncbi:S-layer homology domain-containing protein [Salisediminibacterium selenitireducens]|uniref:S-layer domain protein n=1 Tax=Bacillus selenitireducens (strain ATCC 700615 / DSM 15326 / MLS10) TaxID=439292 RepID=D6Y0I6_BACIE|nr:S-layer homology domain-containing protein [Salisediminibacterium selenitireducens]ADI00554.1 S-layer domain protein [[Bacillus] selenitireducens MLS10]